MNGEMVTVEVHEKEKLISVASKLANMGYDIDVIYPTIRDVDGVWISEQETVNPKNYYHFCKYCSSGSKTVLLAALFFRLSWDITHRFYV